MKPIEYIQEFAIIESDHDFVVIDTKLDTSKTFATYDEALEFINDELDCRVFEALEAEDRANRLISWA